MQSAFTTYIQPRLSGQALPAPKINGIPPSRVDKALYSSLKVRERKQDIAPPFWRSAFVTQVCSLPFKKIAKPSLPRRVLAKVPRSGGMPRVVDTERSGEASTDNDPDKRPPEDPKNDPGYQRDDPDIPPPPPPPQQAPPFVGGLLPPQRAQTSNASTGTDPLPTSQEAGTSMQNIANSDAETETEPMEQPSSKAPIVDPNSFESRHAPLQRLLDDVLMAGYRVGQLDPRQIENPQEVTQRFQQLLENIRKYIIRQSNLGTITPLDFHQLLNTYDLFIGEVFPPLANRLPNYSALFADINATRQQLYQTMLNIFPAARPPTASTIVQTDNLRPRSTASVQSQTQRMNPGQRSKYAETNRVYLQDAYTGPDAPPPKKQKTSRRPTTQSSETQTTPPSSPSEGPSDHGEGWGGGGGNNDPPPPPDVGASVLGTLGNRLLPGVNFIQGAVLGAFGALQNLPPLYTFDREEAQEAPPNYPTQPAPPGYIYHFGQGTWHVIKLTRNAVQAIAASGLRGAREIADHYNNLLENLPETGGAGYAQPVPIPRNTELPGSFSGFSTVNVGPSPRGVDNKPNPPNRPKNKLRKADRDALREGDQFLQTGNYVDYGVGTSASFGGTSAPVPAPTPAPVVQNPRRNQLQMLLADRDTTIPPLRARQLVPVEPPPGMSRSRSKGKGKGKGGKGGGR